MKDELSYQSGEDFTKARARGRMQSILSTLQWKNSDLLSFYEVTALLKPKHETYLGMRTIPIDKIIGSEGRYHDFTLAFYPKKELLRTRWESIDRAHHQYVNLPPISVYKLGDWYFVRDGNHRVSVAKTQGVEFIDAEVVELDSEIPIEPGLTKRQLSKRVVNYERERFLELYHPEKYLDMSQIEFTAPGMYPEMVNHILVHKYYINQNQTEEISFEEAAKSWFDNVYMPIVREIRHERLLSTFPGHTEGDLYMWIVRHWDNLKNSTGSQDVSIHKAASDYKKRFGKGTFQRWVDRMKEVLSRD
ncbi:MAG: transcriptional regulator [Sphaerochaetaceae bacterium]|nr:transcriptional regulator [Sphaerochaetaceae bacterium]